MARHSETGLRGGMPYGFVPMGSAEILAASDELSEFDWPEPPSYSGKTPPMEPNVRVDSDWRI